MKATTIFAICLVATAFAGRIDSIFSDIPDTDFARTMIQTIDLQLKSGEQVDGLISMMSGVQADLKGQLADSTAAHKANDQACADDRRELAGGVSQAETDLAKFQMMQEFDGATLASREEELSNKQESLAGRREILETLTAQREAELEAVTAQLEEYQMVFTLLDDVRAIINERLVGGAEEFLQTSMGARIVEVVNNFQPKSAHGPSHKYHGFFKVLAQVVSKSMEVHADQSIIDNMMEAIDRIEENLSMAESVEREAEAQRRADFEELSTKVQEQIQYVMRQMVDLNATIATLQSRIANMDEALAVAQQNFDAFSARLADREAECEILQNVWEQFSNNMSGQLQTMGKIMYLIEDKRALLARYGL